MSGAVAGLLLTACAETSDLVRKALERDDVEVCMTTTSCSTVKNMRAVDGLYERTSGFVGTEQVEVYMKDNNSTDAAENCTYSVGAPYSTTFNGESGTMMSELTPVEGLTPLRYPSGTSGSIKLYGVFPATSTTTHTVAYRQTNDDTGNSNYQASDLMWGQSVDGSGVAANVTWATFDEKTALATTNKPNMMFQHQLVKLKIVLVKENDVKQVTHVELKNVKRSVAITDVSTTGMTLGEVSTADDGADAAILLSEGETAAEGAASVYTYCCVFPAQAWGSDSTPEEFLTISADNATTTYRLLRDSWVAGNEYTLTINMNELALGTTIDIKGWDDNSTATINPTVTGGGSMKLAPMADCTYNGKKHIPEPTVTLLDEELQVGTDFEYLYFANTNAGTAIVMAVGKGNYEGEIGIGQFTINPRSLTTLSDEVLISLTDADSYVYDGVNKTPDYSVTDNGLEDADAQILTKDIDYTATGDFTEKNAGDYTITITGINNYKDSREIAWNIQKAPLTITADNQSRQYKTDDPTWTFSYSGFVNGETSTVLTTQPSATTTATSESIVGTYDIIPSGAEAANYDISYANGTLTVNKKTITLTCSTTALSFGTDAVNSTKTKTGVSCSDGTISVSSSNTSGCTVSYSNGTITVTRKSSSAFTATITVSVTPPDTDNYTTPSNMTFTVSAALLDKTGTVEDDGDSIKVYTSSSSGYRIPKSNTSSGVAWSNNASWGTKAQWQEIFNACGGTGYNALNSKASGISGWTQMSGSYWSCTEYSSGNAWVFGRNGWDDLNKYSASFVRTISAFTDD